MYMVRHGSPRIRKAVDTKKTRQDKTGVGFEMGEFKTLFLSDNMSVVHIINTHTSQDHISMDLVRELVINTMTHNIDFHSKHI